MKSLTVNQLRHRADELCDSRRIDVMVDYEGIRLGSWFALADREIVARSNTQTGVLRTLIAWLESRPARVPCPVCNGAGTCMLCDDHGFVPATEQAVSP